MEAKRDFKAVEDRWARHWETAPPWEVDMQRAQRPYYNLMMFPYPSAQGLHTGNVFSYVGADVHGRLRRAQGFDVFEPMGFDAFGIHSENYALKTGDHPARQVPANIPRFRRQLQRLGTLLDWRHQVDTTEPAYYRWTQWIFVQLFKAGLAYQQEAPVTWCPSCRTVLAAEQAQGGACERCDSAVEQRSLRQWFFRITRYAQELLDELDRIDWSPVITEAQRRWIGRSQGVEIHFGVEGTDADIEVFTTRADTLWGATYLALAPEHELVDALSRPRQRRAVQDYVAATRRLSQRQRQQEGRPHSGVFTGAYAVHPATGAPVPVWIADYVLTGYGTGAIMGVPAHDERDAAFAQAHGLPVAEVVRGDGEGVLVHSGPFSGLAAPVARRRIGAWLEERGHGRCRVHYRLRDWCISRQRYWGPPIPIVHCPGCGPVAVPESELPVVLPVLEDFAPDGSGRSPLARCPDFVATACPQCSGAARRETDVSDNFLDSAWYFLRYPSVDCQDGPTAPAATAKWLPVDMYIGGREHAVLHLLYSRFLTRALRDLGLIDFAEPFKRFRANGTIVKDGAKMSKSKGNVVNPDIYLERYGADVFRTYLMFMGPFQEGGDFRDGGINGVRRFLQRVWRWVEEADWRHGPIAERPVEGLLHRQIRKVSEEMEALRYNTAIAGAMELFNGLQEAPPYRQAGMVLVQLLAPFAPFIAQEMWTRLGGQGWVGDAPWPRADEDLARVETVEIVLQVDGRVRDRLVAPVGMSQADVEGLALARPRLSQWVGRGRVRRIVFVPDRLLNVVLG